MGVFLIVILYFLVGLIASIFGSLAGLGGGIIIKPILDLIGHYDAATVTILSAATVFSMATVSLLSYMRLDLKVNVQTSLYIAIGSIVGGMVGKSIFLYVMEKINASTVVIVLQSAIIFVLILSIYVLVKHRGKIKTYQLTNSIIKMGIGIILGVIAAFLGIGGGPLNVAILALLFSMGVKESALNSIFIIFFSQLSSLVYTGATTGFGSIDGPVLFCMILGGMTGGFLGSRFSKHLADKTVERIFNIGLIVIMLISLTNIAVYFM